MEGSDQPESRAGWRAAAVIMIVVGELSGMIPLAPSPAGRYTTEIRGERSRTGRRRHARRLPPRGRSAAQLSAEGVEGMRSRNAIT